MAERLNPEGWEAASYTFNIPHAWWAPLIAEIPRGSCVCELGCGVGNIAINLAQADMDYKFSLIDFSENLLNIAKHRFQELEAAMHTRLPVTFYLADVLEAGQYPTSHTIYQSGLLEHFTEEQMEHILRMSGRCAKQVVSMVPNAGCGAYMRWKAEKEANGTWEYGIEIPQTLEGMTERYENAGLKVTRAYSIGTNFQSFGPMDKYLLVVVGEAQ